MVTYLQKSSSAPWGRGGEMFRFSAFAASPAAGAFFSRERKEAKGRLGNYVS
jgi:hypothetical protein